MEDLNRNELDFALNLLIPAVTTCGNPRSPKYLDLKVFEQTVQATACLSGLLADKRGRRVLDERVAGEVEVAFRHSMHDAAMVMAMSERVSVHGGGRGLGDAGVRGGGLIKLNKPPSGGDSSEALEASMPLGILSLALEFVSTEIAASERSVESTLTGLPMMLLEDFLESQGRETCKEFWSMWVEPNSQRLTTPAMMQGGRYTLIRLCKKLAQRMSKTHDSSFCGQMHLFLSKALGFFERSGLNVTGGVNFDNVTAFEGEEQFRNAMWGFGGEEEASAARTATASGARVDHMDVDPGDRKGAQRRQQPQQQQQQEFAVDYLLYQSFWRLQEYALKPDVAVKGEKAQDTWKAILHDVDKILGAFEASSFSEDDLRLARAKWTSASLSISSAESSTIEGVSGKGKRKRGAESGTNVEEEEGAEAYGWRGKNGRGSGYFGLKYLTSSRLLRLQLRDPTLRLQVLTQWLILAASLKSKVTKDKDSPNSGADLNPRMERAKELVKATPPRGKEYLSMLETVIHREGAWTQWKDVGKCNVIDPVADAEAKAREAAAAAAPSKPMRKKRRVHTSGVDVERAKRQSFTFAPLVPRFKLGNTMSKLDGAIPSTGEHLEDQRMCVEDPETDPSDLPSASPLYTWRALRVVGAEIPTNLANSFEGDLVEVMRYLDEAQNAANARAEAAMSVSVAIAPAPASQKASRMPAASVSRAPTPSETPAAAAATPTHARVAVSNAAPAVAVPVSRAPAPIPSSSSLNMKASATLLPPMVSLKMDTTREVTAGAVEVRGKETKQPQVDPPAKSRVEGVNRRTAIVVDGEGDEGEELREAEGKEDNVSATSRRVTNHANGVDGKGNNDASAQRAAKTNASKRTASPASLATSPPPAALVASVGESQTSASTTGRLSVATGDNPKTPIKAKKSPMTAVTSPTRKTASPSHPTLMGWMAPAAGSVGVGAAAAANKEGKNGSKANANGDTEGTAPIPAMSPKSRVTRRRSKSLGKDASDGGK